ncbi:MAG: argininosuccinate lyase [Candidatus Bathyarchaeota archaeon B63]|nr:MAG: argininosuccinate lyase [Candidatus Bathyarchaeota archaeon B63]
MSDLLRKGRLGPARRDVVRFVSSAKDDEKILKQIVDINRAHIVMLVESGIISSEEGGRILKALTGLDEKVELKPEDEDAHVAVEEQVIKEVGPEVGGNLNLAKSRNDQVSTAIRMKLREEILRTAEAVIGLQEALIRKAEDGVETIMVGYTHLQPAQPITTAHYFIAQFDALQRSLERLREAYSRVNECPMGAGALATTSFPISRGRVAELLGFDGVLENSLDAVSSRDFLLEALAVLSVLAVDLSRIAEDLVVYSTWEFGVVELPDEYAFTSSIMPQKKNPDVLEVIRARMGLIIGDFAASAAVLKALPTGYNLDFQEATPRLWAAAETATWCLRMLADVVLNLKVRSVAETRPELSFLAATELANMLFRDHGVPFRTAHRIVGSAVKRLIGGGKALRDLTPEVLEEAALEILGSPLKVDGEEIMRIVDLSRCVESCSVMGGPSRREAEGMLKERRRLLACSREWVSRRIERLKSAEARLNAEAERIIRYASVTNRNA